VCIGCYYIAGERKKAVVVAATALGMLLVFYWLPFLRKDPMIFIKGYQYHTTAAYGEWLNDLSVLKGKFYLYNGFGFTAWALKFIPGDLKHILTSYQRLQLALCFVTVVSLLYYFVKNRTIIDTETFLLFSFKIYLTVFYAFIQIPYKYLYLMPVIISSVLLVMAFRYRRPVKTEKAIL
jgi:hypothetical protein